MTEIPKRKSHPALVIGIGVLVIFGALYWFLGVNGPVLENQQGKITGRGPSVLAAADAEVFNQLASASVPQLAEWQQAGRVALLPVGTRVLVLSVDGIQSKVRVLDTGEEYYVQTTSVGH